jgi:arylsulfatase A-like enzyme
MFMTFTLTDKTAEKKTIYIIDKLSNARVDAPHANHTGIQQVSIFRDNRPGIFQHPPSRIELDLGLLGDNPKLFFACGIKQKIWDKLSHGIIFEIQIKTTFGKPLNIFKREVSPSDLIKEGWLEHELDLSRYSNKKIKLIFSTSVSKGHGTEYCWSIWGNPRIEHETPTVKKHMSQAKPAHIFLITTDALRADHIGVYGNAEVQTPNMDQLANDGAMFTHARAQTTSTLGSHASMLLSQHPHVHSVDAEWGAITNGLPSLPGHLRRHGYKTILVPSELELTDPRTGLPPLFDECMPCLGDPAQDGSITTRIFLDLLAGQNKKTFFWLHYFDTHPPVTPPEPYRSMYYNGEPDADANHYRPEAVRKIKGTEVMQDLTVSLPSLRQGFIDGLFLDKLDATALAFRGHSASEPDLAIHVRNLGTKAHKNMELRQFAGWLEEQVVKLKDGIVPDALLQWLDEIHPMLQEINDDITTWLDGVMDFRYPVAQYKSAISYFDSHLGQLFSYLKQNDLYEQSLIVFTSPHGEILDEHDIYFHHHTLTESSLRIPMIIKPSQNGMSFKAGERIDGIFDSLDIFPTVIDMLGLSSPQGLAGISRATHIQDGSPIPEHDSYAVNNAFTLASVTHGGYKFMKAEKDHLNSEQWRWRKGDQVLFDLHDTLLDEKNQMDEFPQLAKEMEQRLDLFLKDIPS